ncbi:hypothetical protein C8J56DRAFT_1102280 [Mycena floridula]|nr:hypothetical protein C8J56DRAFT_1102280 [Mycena floridula]
MSSRSLPPPLEVRSPHDVFKVWDFSQKDESTQLASITPEILVRFSLKEFAEIHGYVVCDFIEAPSRSTNNDAPLNMEGYTIFPWGPGKGDDLAGEGPANQQYLVPTTYRQVAVCAQGKVIGMAALPPWQQRDGKPPIHRRDMATTQATTTPLVRGSWPLLLAPRSMRGLY